MCRRLSFLLLGLILLFLPTADAAVAHDFWISKEGRRNGAGEWCCGTGDCHAVDDAVTGGLGWSIPKKLEGGAVYDHEFVPYSEAVPSPDGKLWICRRPDKTRRCVFGPPPNT